MPMRFHALAALVLGNLCFPSFFQRAHSDFQIREFRFNHVTRCVATELYGGMRERCKVACETRYSIVTKEGWFCVARYSRSHSARASLEFFAMSHLCPYRQLPSEKFALPNLSVAGSKSLSRPNAQQNTWLLAIPCGEKDESEQRMSALRIRRNKLSLAERPLRLQQ